MGLRILHYADIENATDDPERIGRLCGLVNARQNDDTIVTGGGDNTAPGALSLVTGGRHALDVFGSLEPDLDTLGNHDFDHGLDRTRALIADSPQTWIAANVRHGGTPFGADAGVRPWAIIERDAVRVGFVGLLTPTTPQITPTATALSVTDPIPAARDAVCELRDRGVTHVVALSHLGAGDDALAAAVDLDLILGGHLHDPRIDRIDGTLLVRPGSNARAIVEVTLDGDERTVEHLPTDDAPIDATVVETLRKRRDEAGLDDVVATANTSIERTRASAFEGESRIGNLVADAYRWATGADVGLQNGGGIREGPPLSGPVTIADLVGVVPFDEPVTVGEVTGQELRAIVRQAAGGNAGYGDPDWWHAHLSGASVVWDDDRDEVEQLRIEGHPVEPDTTYAIATSDYLFATDLEFPALTPAHRIERGDRQYDVLVDYVCAVGLEAPLEGRVVRAAADGDGGGPP